MGFGRAKGRCLGKLMLDRAGMCWQCSEHNLVGAGVGGKTRGGSDSTGLSNTVPSPSQAEPTGPFLLYPEGLVAQSQDPAGRSTLVWLGEERCTITHVLGEST